MKTGFSQQERCALGSFPHPFIFIGSVSLVLGLCAGYVMHRSDFCLAGMFRDFFLFGRTIMIKSLVLLILSSMLLFEVSRRLGLLSAYPFPLLYPASAGNLIGGWVFGIGMVLAGGCVVGTLYKMGAGSLLSLAAFGGLILGSGLYAEIHPTCAAFVKQTTLFPGRITVSQLANIDPAIPVLIVSVPCGLLLWRIRTTLERRAFASGYVQPFRAALVLSVISTISYALLGMPMGVTSSFTKIAGWFERALLPTHFDALAFFRTEPLKYVHGITGAVLTGGPGPHYDALAAIQIPLITGIIAGSALSAALLGELKVTYRVPLRQYGLSVAGGVFMGFGSRLAPTCNVWHLLGGLPILALSSILFLVGMLGGAWCGAKMLVRALGQSSSPKISALQSPSGVR